MTESLFERHLLELIRRAACDLPADIETALRAALARERAGADARWVLRTILENIARARRDSVPMCQDTGALLFYCGVPAGFDTNRLGAAIRLAVARATRLGYLRQNTVDALSGAGYDTNVGCGAPVIHVEQSARKTLDIRLMLKGGGCENVGRQYSLPDTDLDAGRDLEGVRRCILDAVWRAQGRGCAPGVLGVCIGGDRATGYACSKEQFLRRLNDSNPVRALAALERGILRDARELGIGPMGLGGRTTLLGVKIGVHSRLPASFFVTVSYMCWAYRRRGVVLGPEGGLGRWLY